MTLDHVADHLKSSVRRDSLRQLGNLDSDQRDLSRSGASIEPRAAAARRRKLTLKKVAVDLLTGQDNFAILKLPDRRFPGSLIPGDSLKFLRDLAKSIAHRAEGTDDQELIDEAKELFHKLSERLEHYERVCRKNGLSLPYSET